MIPAIWLVQGARAIILIVAEGVIFIVVVVSYCLPRVPNLI